MSLGSKGTCGLSCCSISSVWLTPTPVEFVSNMTKTATPICTMKAGGERKRHTVLFESLNCCHHFAIQLPRGRVVERTVARTVIVLQVFRVRAVSNSPLRSLLNGEEPELAVALARRRLSLTHLWAHSFRRLARSVTDKQDLLQAGDSLLRPTDNNSIAHRSAIV